MAEAEAESTKPQITFKTEVKHQDMEREKAVRPGMRLRRLTHSGRLCERGEQLCDL